MIEMLQELLPEILDSIHNSLYHKGVNDWDSLVINRRKPHTTRAFRMFGENRVCLHRFEPCEEEDCFSHPHPWPGAFLMLKGEYIHTVGCTNFLIGKKKHVQWLFREIVRPYSMYEITNPFVWHGVHPLKQTWTIMMNGPEFDNKHEATVTTKGKDLDSLPANELGNHLTYFEILLSQYLNIT